MPIFRALRPGYHPWYTTENEGVVLAECIEAVLALCERISKGDGVEYWKDAWTYPSMVSSKAGGDDKRYDVEMVKVTELPAATPEPAQLDQNRIRQIRDRKYPVCGAFEAEHFYGGAMVGKRSERKACVRLGLVVDANSGLVFPPELGMPERATSDIIATALLNAIDTAQCLPREIRVHQHEFKPFLQPLSRELGIPVRTVKRLPALQEAKEHLLTMMGDPGRFIAS